MDFVFWEVSGGADTVVCGVVDGEGIAGEFIVVHDGFLVWLCWVWLSVIVRCVLPSVFCCLAVCPEHVEAALGESVALEVGHETLLELGLFCQCYGFNLV